MRTVLLSSAMALILISQASATTTSNVARSECPKADFVADKLLTHITALLRNHADEILESMPASIGSDAWVILMEQGGKLRIPASQINLKGPLFLTEKKDSEGRSLCTYSNGATEEWAKINFTLIVRPRPERPS